MVRPEVEIDINDDFGTRLLAAAAIEPPSGPRAFYNVDGDCIEFLVGSESYYAERIDTLVTVYYGRDSGQIVGGLIKGVRRFINEILKSCPGFAIEVEDGPVKLGYLFTAGMWKQGDKVRRLAYKKLRDQADESGLSVEVPELVG